MPVFATRCVSDSLHGDLWKWTGRLVWALWVPLYERMLTCSVDGALVTLPRPAFTARDRIGP